MCGIFGYVGKKQDTPGMILKGLKLLEYRGYDSWGIAVKNGDGIEVEKHVGKIGDAKVSLPESEIGIGHTRWATHGGVTQENSHPHLDCKRNIAVVHNGIIENYKEIKEELILKGHDFLSETDTEIFPHLIEENLKSLDFETAFIKSFNAIKGLNAIVCINLSENKIASAKTGSPLISRSRKWRIFYFF
jgi:glutamine---fructose-6-phosphate transaminase (isomerizing)